MAEQAVRWSARAENEYLKTLEFYQDRNKSISYSREITKWVNSAIQQIARFPYIGRLSDDNKRRVLVVRQFLLFYEVRNEVIYIVSFWDNRRDPSQRVDQK